MLRYGISYSFKKKMLQEDTVTSSKTKFEFTYGYFKKLLNIGRENEIELIKDDDNDICE